VVTSWADQLKKVLRNGKGNNMATKKYAPKKATGVRSATRIINDRMAKKAKAKPKPKPIKPKAVSGIKKRANKMFDSF